MKIGSLFGSAETVCFIRQSLLAYIMAKSDSFFIRASVDFNGTTFAQNSIDLGAYVDALGKSVLRVHRASVKYGNPIQRVLPSGATNTGANVGWQLTTQSQTSLVPPTDKSVISQGELYCQNDAGGNTILLEETQDINPQDWQNGYLVGVEQIYLSCDQTAATDLTRVVVVLECTVETLSQSAAMALALSQQ